MGGSQLRIRFGHNCNCKKLGAMKKSSTCNKKNQTNRTPTIWNVSVHSSDFQNPFAVDRTTVIDINIFTTVFLTFNSILCSSYDVCSCFVFAVIVFYTVYLCGTLAAIQKPFAVFFSIKHHRAVYNFSSLAYFILILPTCHISRLPTPLSLHS